MSRALVRAAASAAGLILLCFAAFRYAVHVPAVVPASAAQTSFSAERAMSHVRAIARRPHPSGSVDHARVQAYLMAQLSRLGLTPVVQHTTGVGTRYPAAGIVTNVLGRLPGAQAGGNAVLLMAHYDGVPASPAAADDASGSAVLLETLRALREGPRLTNDIIVLFTDAEEAGLLGAAAFVREHAWAAQSAVVINVEARGTHGPSLMFETGPGNLDVARALRRAAGRAGRATSLSTAVYRKLPNDTDLSELALLARPALNFAFIGGVQRYHTAQDDTVQLDARSVQAHGTQVLALAREFGNAELPRPVTSDAVFFDVPLAGLVVYPESWAPMFAALALALAVMVVLRLRRSEPRWISGVVTGALACILGTAVAVGAGVGLVALLTALHDALRSGSVAWNGGYVASVALLAFAGSALVYVAARRIAAARALHAGALVVWGLLAILTAAAMPGASFLFAWPLLFSASAALVALLVNRQVVARLDIWIAATVTVFILLPTAWLMAGVALGLGAASAAIVATLAALTTWLLAPIAEDLGGDRPWWLPASAAIVAVVLAAAGAVTERYDADNPVRSALTYAFDASSNSAWLSGAPGAPPAEDYARSAVAAAARAAGRASDATGSAAIPTWVRRRARGAVVGPAPLAPLPPARVTKTGDSTDAESRTVALLVEPGAGVLAVELAVDSASISTARISGKAIDRSRYRRQSARWALEVVAPADTGFTLELTFPADARPVLTVVSARAGIPAALRLPTRPPGVLASQDGDISVSYTRFPF